LLKDLHPELRKKIRFLSLMGAEIDIIHRENNIVLDPEAADIVLRSGIPSFIGTWSVTRRLFYPQTEAEEKISTLPDSEWRDFFLESTRRWRQKTGTGKPGPVLYDIIPVFFAAGYERYIQTAAAKEIIVELKGEYTRGLTFLPGCSRWSYFGFEEGKGIYSFGADAEKPLLVSMAMDYESLKREYDRLVFNIIYK
jgi:inosine-uridine nucleoside N-ribohydrolase